MSVDHFLVCYSGIRQEHVLFEQKEKRFFVYAKNLRKDQPSVVQETNLYSSTSMNVNKELANLFMRYDIVCSYVTHCTV